MIVLRDFADKVLKITDKILHIAPVLFLNMENIPIVLNFKQHFYVF